MHCQYLHRRASQKVHCWTSSALTSCQDTVLSLCSGPLSAAISGCCLKFAIESACWSAVSYACDETLPTNAEHGADLDDYSTGGTIDGHERARTQANTSFASWIEEAAGQCGVCGRPMSTMFSPMGGRAGDDYDGVQTDLQSRPGVSVLRVRSC
jgi:hypothetical protein